MSQRVQAHSRTWQPANASTAIVDLFMICFLLFVAVSLLAYAPVQASAVPKFVLLDFCETLAALRLQVYHKNDTNDERLLFG
jgi:hypothetical protein